MKHLLTLVSTLVPEKKKIKDEFDIYGTCLTLLTSKCFLLLLTQKWCRFISLDFLTAGVTKTVFVHSMDAPLLLCDILALSLRKKADIATFDDDNLVKTTKTLCIYRAAIVYERTETLYKTSLY